MNILVVNDDGYEAWGLYQLARTVKKYGEVTIVAPEGERSGVSHSTNIRTAVTFEKVDNPEFEVYKTSGNPADCTRLAIGLLDKKFDIVFSGINEGYNIGTDVYYSGTVAGVREAIVEGIPGIAVSTGHNQHKIVEEELEDILDYIMDNHLYNENYVLNINFPYKKHEHSKGLRFTRIGRRCFKSEFGKTEDGKWVEIDHKIETDNWVDSDVTMQNEGYITISPLGLDETDYYHLGQLRDVQKKTGRK
ncbi:MAG: 5'/3'-nucleotidase SurE [Acholeplasmatales bacterium]|nr:5'/3'-nucleotidase SurE [Acholeplasmatales bacterium]